MIAATAVASIVLFALALWKSHVVRVSSHAVMTARSAAGILRDASLDDAAREKAIQQSSLSLFADFASILVRSVISLAVSLAPIWLADAAGLARAGDVGIFLARPEVLIGATVLMTLAFFAGRRVAARLSSGRGDVWTGD